MSRYRKKWRPVYILPVVHCKRIAIFGLVAAHSTRMILNNVQTKWFLSRKYSLQMGLHGGIVSSNTKKEK